MKTVVITDGKYRSSIAAARVLGRSGYRVVVTQTKGDAHLEPPVFSSKYVSETKWIDGSVKDPGYAGRLIALVSQYERPVLVCVGAGTLNTVSGEQERFRQVCDFLIAEPVVLDALNDKEQVHRRCIELGIPVPRQYSGEPASFPVIIKPHCGEKFGLKAGDRYAVANNRAEYDAAMERMLQWDPEPIVQDQIRGDGIGISLLLDGESRLICALCHRRVREYPISGGPSTCCESFYDEKLISQSYELLKSFRFTGIAMVEWKGDCVLEVNPRIWGSFPMTECAGSPYICCYAQAANSETVEYHPENYKTGVRMRFMLNDAVAALHYLCRGQIGSFWGAVRDFFLVGDALSAGDDPAPLRRYLRQYILRR